ncbi:MAG: hypothetical protein IPP40_16490 [bacterium]|nr:hypothetical protein [bacterium]
MKHKHRSLIWSTGAILLAMVLLAAPMACQLMPCCRPVADCCDSCHDEKQPESGDQQDSDCANGHCLNATMSIAAPQIDEVVFLPAVTTDVHWIDGFVLEYSSDPLYRPPIAAC